MTQEEARALRKVLLARLRALDNPPLAQRRRQAQERESRLAELQAQQTAAREKIELDYEHALAAEAERLKECVRAAEARLTLLKEAGKRQRVLIEAAHVKRKVAFEAACTKQNTPHPLEHLDPLQRSKYRALQTQLSLVDDMLATPPGFAHSNAAE
jgi:hypothetical protein